MISPEISGRIQGISAMPQILSNQLRIPSHVNMFIQNLKFQEFQAQMPHLETHAAVIVFRDSDSYWAAEDLEFVLAAQEVNVSINIKVEIGDERAAALHYMKSLFTTTNLLRNTKLLAEVLLKDQEWNQWSDMEIAEFCNLTLNQVRRLRGKVAVF